MASRELSRLVTSGKFNFKTRPTPERKQPDLKKSPVLRSSVSHSKARLLNTSDNRIINIKNLQNTLTSKAICAVCRTANLQIKDFKILGVARQCELICSC